MPTVSPSYSLKGVSNPYYVMDPSVTTVAKNALKKVGICLLYTSPSPRDEKVSRMPSSA